MVCTQVDYLVTVANLIFSQPPLSMTDMSSKNLAQPLSPGHVAQRAAQPRQQGLRAPSLSKIGSGANGRSHPTLRSQAPAFVPRIGESRHSDRDEGQVPAIQMAGKSHPQAAPLVPKTETAPIKNDLARSPRPSQEQRRFTTSKYGDGRAGYKGGRPDERNRQKPARQSRFPLSKPLADLALNRFRFVLAPSSSLNKLPLSALLALPSSELWPHAVALRALDVDPICSLCLDVVMGARALMCGHIFCAVCIHRCLQAAQHDPMLEKCPVCLEGELSIKGLRRCEVMHEKELPSSFVLVYTPSCESPVPCHDSPIALTTRITKATGESMMELIQKERRDLAICKEDLKRFRDGHGLQILAEIEHELDNDHVEWNRQVGKRKASDEETPYLGSGDWCYQRSNGTLDFLHPLHLRCLLRNAEGDLSKLPQEVRPKLVIEVEDWSGKTAKLAGMLKLTSAQLPEFAPCCRLYEVELQGMTKEALASVAKETRERARRREEKAMRKLKSEQATLERDISLEEQRRRAREAEESLIRAFFGFEERRAESEAQEAKDRPKPAVNSFSAIVSNMGHFPTLQATAVAAKTSSKSSSPGQHPQGAWGTTSQVVSPGTSPVNSVSFAQATTQGPGKKVLWQNNPGRRSEW